MKDRQRVVVDTSAIVSRLLLPASIPGQAVDKAVDEALLLISEATLEELADVLARAKFDPYVTVGERQEFLRLLDRIAVIVPIIHTIRACRDARDDKFLELAVNGEAGLIITGDADLLELDPFQGIPIITPANYLGQ
jgi:putative PIN family toxin of toxin-antitoxin system